MTYPRFSRFVILASVGALLATTAQAQQFTKPWGFTQQNRGQLAVAMKQMEGGGSGALGGGGGGGTTIVCGGGGATATANSTCIIMNNSSGTVMTDQISDGDQTASTSEQVTLNGEPISGADEVLTTLAQ